MKFLKLFRKKEKSTAVHPRRSKPYDDFSSDDSRSGSSDGSSHSSGANSSHNSNCLRAVVGGMFEEQHQQLTEAFRIIDKNRDGKISGEELKAMWANIGEKVTDDEVRFMVHEVDENGDGKIDLQEFTTLNRKFGIGIAEPEEYDEELQLAFIMADVNRDGRISASELQKVMKASGIKKLTVAESYAMLRFVDSDNDDLINFQEFEQLMRSSIFSGNTH